MPRLTNERYYQRHLLLRQIWLHQQDRYSHLSHEQQWQLHDYYKPSHELSQIELLQHRHQVSHERPALPATASKAFKLLIDASLSPTTALSLNKAATGNRHIRVRGIARPQPNLDQLAKALLTLAEHLVADERSDSIERHADSV